MFLFLSPLIFAVVVIASVGAFVVVERALRNEGAIDISSLNDSFPHCDLRFEWTLSIASKQMFCFRSWMISFPV